MQSFIVELTCLVVLLSGSALAAPTASRKLPHTGILIDAPADFVFADSVKPEWDNVNQKDFALQLVVRPDARGDFKTAAEILEGVPGISSPTPKSDILVQEGSGTFFTLLVRTAGDPASFSVTHTKLIAGKKYVCLARTSTEDKARKALQICKTIH